MKTFFLPKLLSILSCQDREDTDLTEAPATEVTRSMNNNREFLGKRSSIFSTASTCPPYDDDFTDDFEEQNKHSLSRSFTSSSNIGHIYNYPRRRFSTGSLTEHLYEELKIKHELSHSTSKIPPVFPLNGGNRPYHISAHRYLDMLKGSRHEYENRVSISLNAAPRVVSLHPSSRMKRFISTRSLLPLPSMHENCCNRVPSSQTVNGASNHNQSPEQNNHYLLMQKRNNGTVKRY